MIAPVFALACVAAAPVLAAASAACVAYEALRQISATDAFSKSTGGVSSSSSADDIAHNM